MNFVELNSRNIDPPFYFMHCAPKPDGSYVFGVPPASVNKSRLPKTVYNSMEEVLQHEGLYTWVLFRDGTFRAHKFVSPHELLSKHKNIYRNVRQPILAAGECRIDTNRAVDFNLSSGMFMQKIGAIFQKKYATSHNATYNEKITQLWKNAGATVVRIFPFSPSFFPQTISDEAIQLYSAANYRFHTFPTKAECLLAEEDAKNQYNRNFIPNDANYMGGRRMTRSYRGSHKNTRKRRY